jgi:hypothetical protein
MAMKIVGVEVIERYVLRLSFEDGSTGTVDLGELAGRGVFKAWEAPGAFEDVAIGSGGEVTWRGGVDLCGDALYLKVSGKSAADLFPVLSGEGRCA